MSKLSRKNMTKKKRNDEETFNIPEALSKVTLPRNVDLESFFEARMLELDHFLSILNDKAAVGGKMGNKKSFQLLPKHMRRRAMSHNSHRVPSRIRHLAQSSAQLKNPCRKTRKHVQKIIKDYQDRVQKVVWLETHIWHAKRMKMRSLWGYKIAIHSNDKGIRAAYRFMKNSSVIYDSSYFVGVIVYDLDFIRTCLQSMPKTGFSIKTHFFHRENLVCPVEAFNTKDGICIIVHPAAFSQIIQIFSEANIKYLQLKDQLSLYRIRGAKSTQVLSKVINIQETSISNLLSNVSQFHNIKFPEGAIISISLAKKLSKVKPTVKTMINAPELMIPLQPSADILNLLVNWPSSLYNATFWSSFKEEQSVSYSPQFITTRSARSRYPTLNKKAPPKPKPEDINVESNIIEKSPGINQKIEIDEIEESKIEIPCINMEIDEIEEEKIEIVEALLVYRKEEFGDGWDIILKSGENNWLWRSLVYGGAKAIGLKEYSSIHFEQGRQFYPNDYPTTEAYKAMSLIEAQERLNVYFRRPSSKRMNFERIGSPYPFFSNWSNDGLNLANYGELIPIQIKCLNRCPQPLAYLCLADQQDFQNKRIHYKEPLRDRSTPNSKIELVDIDKLSIIKPTRTIIGFVTSGGFSFHRAKGFGIGCIFSDFKSNIGQKILFRNPSSQFYHICSLVNLSS